MKHCIVFNNMHPATPTQIATFFIHEKEGEQPTAVTLEKFEDSVHTEHNNAPGYIRSQFSDHPGHDDSKPLTVCSPAQVASLIVTISRFATPSIAHDDKAMYLMF